MNIQDLPPKIQEEIDAKGLRGSAHALASIEENENSFAILGFMQKSLHRWDRGVKLLVTKYATSGDRNHLIEVCALLSTKRDAK